jgi:hypothetical protein
MTKTAAQRLCDDFMRTVNGRDEPEDGRNRPVLLREFVDQVPFQPGKMEEINAGNLASTHRSMRRGDELGP